MHAWNRAVRGGGIAAAGMTGGTSLPAPEATLTVTNCTFWGNSANPEAEPNDPIYAAIYSWSPDCEKQLIYHTTIRNTIVWNNGIEPVGVDLCGSSPPTPGIQIDVRHCDLDNGVYISVGTSNISSDPLFLNAAGATPFNHQLGLSTCTPAANTGLDSWILDDHTDINDAVPDPNSPGWDPNDPNAVIWDHHKNIRRLGPLGLASLVDIGAYETCLGDTNADRQVGIFDLSTVVGCLGGPASCAGATNCCLADIQNCDGTVDLSDLAQVLGNYGTICAAPLQACGGSFGRPGGEEESDTLLDLGYPPSDDPFIAWLQSLTVSELLEWYRAGMPH